MANIQFNLVIENMLVNEFVYSELSLIFSYLFTRYNKFIMIKMCLFLATLIFYCNMCPLL